AYRYRGWKTVALVRKCRCPAGTRCSRVAWRSVYRRSLQYRYSTTVLRHARSTAGASGLGFFRYLPQVDQLQPLHFARWTLGQFIDDTNFTGRLVAAQCLAAMMQQGFRIGRHTRFQRDGGIDFLAVIRVRQP